jgi:hypothetical protein
MLAWVSLSCITYALIKGDACVMDSPGTELTEFLQVGVGLASVRVPKVSSAQVEELLALGDRMR